MHWAEQSDPRGLGRLARLVPGARRDVMSGRRQWSDTTPAVDFAGGGCQGAHTTGGALTEDVVARREPRPARDARHAPPAHSQVRPAASDINKAIPCHFAGSLPLLNF